MKKYPFQKFLIYLILARTEYPSIVAYVSAYRFGKIKGTNLKHLEMEIMKKANDDELDFIENTRVVCTGRPKKTSNKEYNINLVIPNEMQRLAEEFDCTSSPFDNNNVKIITEDIQLRRSVEVYLTTRMDHEEIAKLIKRKFRLKVSKEDIDEYKTWMYDISDITPDRLFEYFSGLEMLEQEYKYMAFMNKEEYIKWKMGDDCNIDTELETMKMMADALHSFKECVRANPPNHTAAKVWSEIYFKCLDRIESTAGTKDKQIFSRFNFNMVKKDNKQPIKFTDLIQENK